MEFFIGIILGVFVVWALRKLSARTQRQHPYAGDAYGFPKIDLEGCMNSHLGPKTGECDAAGWVRREPTLSERAYKRATGRWPNE